MFHKWTNIFFYEFNLLRSPGGGGPKDSDPTKLSK